MQSVVGIALLVVGVVLIIFGMQASASLGSRLSELFTGTPSDRTIWLLILGVVAAIVGSWPILVIVKRELSYTEDIHPVERSSTCGKRPSTSPVRHRSRPYALLHPSPCCETPGGSTRHTL